MTDVPACSSFLDLGRPVLLLSCWSAGDWGCGLVLHDPFSHEKDGKEAKDDGGSEDLALKDVLEKSRELRGCREVGEPAWVGRMRDGGGRFGEIDVVEGGSEGGVDKGDGFIVD
jgi:hypothetical protein